MEWIETSKELPPCDGKYEVTNTYNGNSDIAFYDGYGFEFDGHYVKPKYWKNWRPKEKKYGKQ